MLLRGVMVAGSLAIAAVLLLKGDELFGLLIGGLALLRLVYLLSVSRRRERDDRAGAQ